ncbi:glutaminase kidney isoform, mitochondrial-like [Mytilus trossulus]|uniref:glutaminase kidney isoform, mitochondrial-like n=1 Tax=Mytilus trossulus TaxID=6551 RepID=UPI0030058325
MHRHVTFVKKIIKLENFGRYSKNGFTLVGCCNSVINRHWYNTGTNNPSTYHTQFPAKEEKESWAIQNFEDRLFDYLSDNGDRLSVQKFRTAIANYGLRDSDPRLTESMENLNNVQAQADLHGLFVDKNTFKDCIADNIVLIAKAFHNNFIIPDFPMFRQQIDELYWKAKSNSAGRVANYIPQLARYSPDDWGISICTIDGQRHSVGNFNVPFCLQSTSKPLVYALVQEELNQETVHQYVGHEPSGFTFNAISLDPANKPHNPMINAGAILTCSLLKQNMNLADRFDYVTKMFKRLTGGEYLAFNNAVFLSERETADRNFALGYYMRENKCFPEGTNLMETLDFYFQLCSIEADCDSASVIAATLANGGVCPTTGDKVFSTNSVRNTLSLMHSCGMYDYSGGFAFEVGLPAKSGVSGCIMLVVPNVMGICMWSPPLDKYGNSVRGIQFCKDFVEKFNFHNYDSLIHSPKKFDPRIRKAESRAKVVVNLLFGAYNGDVTALRRYALLGTDMNLGDYDGRTALHVGAAEGNDSVVKFLLEKCKVNPFPRDRWGFTPLDDAVRFGHTVVQKILEPYTEEDKDNTTVDS